MGWRDVFAPLYAAALCALCVVGFSATSARPATWTGRRWGSVVLFGLLAIGGGWLLAWWGGPLGDATVGGLSRAAGVTTLLTGVALAIWGSRLRGSVELLRRGATLSIDEALARARAG